MRVLSVASEDWRKPGLFVSCRKPRYNFAYAKPAHLFFTVERLIRNVL
jgi:hypothetical protein